MNSGCMTWCTKHKNNILSNRAEISTQTSVKFLVSNARDISYLTELRSQYKHWFSSWYTRLKVKQSSLCSFHLFVHKKKKKWFVLILTSKPCKLQFKIPKQQQTIWIKQLREEAIYLMRAFANLGTMFAATTSTSKKNNQKNETKK
jgi:hypothetical protein